MSSILDQVVQVGVESTYGTAVAPTRAYEAKADTFTRDVEYLQSVGFRRDMQTIRSDRDDTISLGATGSIEFDLLNKGAGLLLQHVLGSTSGPTQLGSTSAYRSTFATTDIGPTGSSTIQVSRVDSGGTLRPFTYEGCVATGFNIAQDLGSNLSFTLNFDAENEQTSTGEATPAYPSSADPFNYTQAVIAIDGSAATNFTSFSLDGDLAMDTARRFLNGSATKSQPKRSGVPSYTGTITAEFASLTDYNKFVNGTEFSINASWNGAEIASPYNFECVISIPVAKFTGSTPVASLDSLTTVDLPFTVLDNGSSAPITMTYTSTDTSL
tara:strand:- start:343 stop:1320 length:978 start_codon:yes stop_codon:yes gene_type:complete